MLVRGLRIYVHPHQDDIKARVIKKTIAWLGGYAVSKGAQVVIASQDTRAEAEQVAHDVGASYVLTSAQWATLIGYDLPFAPRFGELRSLCHSPPSALTWLKLLQWLDVWAQRDPETLTVASDYAASALEAWPDAMRWCPEQWLSRAAAADSTMAPLLALCRLLILTDAQRYTTTADVERILSRWPHHASPTLLWWDLLLPAFDALYHPALGALDELWVQHARPGYLLDRLSSAPLLQLKVLRLHQDTPASFIARAERALWPGLSVQVGIDAADAASLVAAAREDEPLSSALDVIEGARLYGR